MTDDEVMGEGEETPVSSDADASEVGDAYGADLDFEFYQPTQVIFGDGCVARELAFVLRRLGCARPLIVTDGVLSKKTDLITAVAAAVSSAATEGAVVFDEVVPDTSVDIVDRGAAAARARECDALISVGGGSSIDTAKAMTIVLAEGGSLRDHQGANALTKKSIPHVAIPTTAGTGSEVSHYAVVKDDVQKEKLHFTDRQLLPDVALLDPSFTVGMSPGLTAATGMDAMTHAIEAYTAINRNPMADAFALEALRLLSRDLPSVFENGKDVGARGRVLLGANLAGMAFSSAGVGLCHAMAHVLGARYGIAHGVANAVCLPHVVRFVGVELDGRYRTIVNTLGVDTIGIGAPGMSATEALAWWLKSLLERLQLPTSLAALGVPEAELGACAEQSLADGAIVYSGRFAGHLRPVLQVYRKAFAG